MALASAEQVPTGSRGSRYTASYKVGMVNGYETWAVRRLYGHHWIKGQADRIFRLGLPAREHCNRPAFSVSPAPKMTTAGLRGYLDTQKSEFLREVRTPLGAFSPRS